MEECGLYSSPENRDRRAVLNMVMNLWVSQTAGSFLTVFYGADWLLLLLLLLLLFQLSSLSYHHNLACTSTDNHGSGFVFWALTPCNLVCGLQHVFEEHIAAVFKVEGFFWGGGRMSSEILVLRYKTTRCRNSTEHRTVTPANSTDNTPTPVFIFAQNLMKPNGLTVNSILVRKYAIVQQTSVHTFELPVPAMKAHERVEDRSTISLPRR